MRKLNIPVIIVGAIGAAYLMPKSQSGIMSAFNYEPQPALIGAAFITLAASIGWSVYRLTRHRLAAVLGVLGLAASISSDTAADWDALTKAQDAPVEAAQAKVDRLEAEQTKCLDQLRTLLSTADAMDNDGNAANDWQVVAHRRDAAKLEVRAADLRGELDDAADTLASLDSQVHLLAGAEWGAWALLAFNGVCEVCLSLLGFFAVNVQKRTPSALTLEDSRRVDDEAQPTYQIPTSQALSLQERRTLARKWKAAGVELAAIALELGVDVRTVQRYTRVA